MLQMKFLMYGAGGIGRGFIGPLFAKAGYEVVFVDINRQIIDALNSRNSYHYTVACRPAYNIPVTGVRGVDGADEPAVLGEIADCDLMAVSLGAPALEKVAPIISKGFSLRMKHSGRPLNLLICENLKDAARLLRGWLKDAMPEEDRALFDEKCGLIETAIGRMVPAAPPGQDDPLHVTVEEYDFLPVDKAAFVGEPPELQELVPYTPFVFYEERKLYLHNMGHAVCAYFGMRQGHETIAEAVRDLSVRILVQSAMTEAAAMLSAKYRMPFAQIFDHAEDLLLRFRNAALGDTCERAARDPIRKLAAGDRLAGTLCQCWEHAVYPVYVALGYASALRYIKNRAEEAEAITMETGRLGKAQTELVMKLFTALDLPMPELLNTVESLKKEFRGNIV